MADPIIKAINELNPTTSQDPDMVVAVDVPSGSGFVTKKIKKSDFVSPGGGAFIPLLGTEVGSPVTGDIEIEFLSGKKIGTGLGGNNQQYISLSDFNNGISLIGIKGGIMAGIQIKFGDGVRIVDEVEEHPLGLYGSQYFGDSDRFTDESFAQKKYVDSDLQKKTPTNASNTTITRVVPNTIAILTPATTIATATVTFDPLAKDGDTVNIANGSPDKDITALTIDTGTDTIIAPLTSMLAGEFAKYKYVLDDTTWYRIG